MQLSKVLLNDKKYIDRATWASMVKKQLHIIKVEFNNINNLEKEIVLLLNDNSIDMVFIDGFENIVILLWRKYGGIFVIVLIVRLFDNIFVIIFY